MRRSLLFCAVAVSSLALGGPGFAQSEPGQSDPGQASSTTSTTTTVTSVTGTVVSSSDTELVIDTATGRQRFVVEAGTSDIPANLAPGTQVTVEFRTSGDRRQVSRVTASPKSGASSTSSSASSTTTPPRSADPTLSAQATRDADRDRDVTTDFDRDRRAGATDRDDDALPATASPLGFVGLLGLLSFGASAALRAWRRLS